MLHRTKSSKEEEIWKKANELFKFEFFPSEFETIKINTKDFKTKILTIFISGIGFFSMKNIGQVIEIKTQKDIEIIIATSIFG
jgi:thymidine kinase